MQLNNGQCRKSQVGHCNQKSVTNVTDGVHAATSTQFSSMSEVGCLLSMFLALFDIAGISPSRCSKAMQNLLLSTIYRGICLWNLAQPTRILKDASIRISCHCAFSAELKVFRICLGSYTRHALSVKIMEAEASMSAPCNVRRA